MSTQPLTSCAARGEPHHGPILSEDHWLRCADPEAMEEFLGESGSPRRWQLFACLCCWRVLPLLDERGRNAVSVAERQAEGLATVEELREAKEEAFAAVFDMWRPGIHRAPANAATAASYALTSPRRSFIYVLNAAGRPAGESDAQCHLLRELFANPFRPFVFDPAWRTPIAMAIAAQSYDRESFEDLPVLADALEDAGCDGEPLLAHLRAATTHHRGCWALDAILDKA